MLFFQNYIKKSCPIEISSWHLNANVLNMASKNSVVNAAFYNQNNVWQLTDFSVTATTEINRLGLLLPKFSPNGNVILNLSIKRRPLYFMLTNYFPCLILNLLTLISFGLPISSQFGLCITIFLTFS